MFPYSITFKSNFKNLLSENDRVKALAYLSSYVENFRGNDILISENNLSFKTNFFGWSWDKFGLIDKGIFHLSDNTLSFKFYMVRLFVITGLMSSLIAYSSGQVFIGIFFFIILGLGNWVTALITFRNMITELAVNINNLKP